MEQDFSGAHIHFRPLVLKLAPTRNSAGVWQTLCDGPMRVLQPESSVIDQNIAQSWFGDHLVRSKGEALVQAAVAFPVSVASPRKLAAVTLDGPRLSSRVQACML